MKWSVVGLMLLGIVAAASAALLVSSLRADGRLRFAGPGGLSDERRVEILIATRDMAAMTKLDATSVTTKLVSEADVLASGYLRSGAVDKVLAVPVSQGHEFTSNDFLTAVPVEQALPQGTRAFSISLTPAQAGLVDPGAVVDVLATVPSTLTGDTGEMTTKIVLQRVEVLAVDERTVFSGRDDGDAPTTPRADRQRLVTIKVDTKQAQQLQSAIKSGNIWLVLRSPLDTAPIPEDEEWAVIVHRGGTRAVEKVHVVKNDPDNPEVPPDKEGWEPGDGLARRVDTAANALVP